MILQGTDLIIKANGVAIAASKSCSIDVSADTIKVSDASDGAWEHSRAGRKSWSITTNHVIVNVESAYDMVKASASRWSEGNIAKVSFKGFSLQETGAGLHLFHFYLNELTGEWEYDVFGPFDTSRDPDVDELVTDLQDTGDGDVKVLVGTDSFTISESLQTAIAQYMKIPVEMIPVGSYRSMTAIGSSNIYGTSEQGIAMLVASRDAGTHAEAYYIDGYIQTLERQIVKAIDKVGATMELTVQVDGHGLDRVTGQAICKQWKGTFTRGNLAQGSFVFEGSGPLE